MNASRFEHPFGTRPQGGIPRSAGARQRGHRQSLREVRVLYLGQRAAYVCILGTLRRIVPAQREVSTTLPYILLLIVTEADAFLRPDV
jgi:hypothetical protein